MPADTPMVLADQRLIEKLDAQDWRGIESTVFRLNKEQADRLKAALSASPVGEGALQPSASQQSRLCPCGKPALATASICSGCADACAADGGEGEAPVARRILWGPGEDWDFSNEADDPLTDADVERLRAQGYVVDRLYTRPTPATPEGLREKVLIADVIRDDRATELPIFLDALEEWGCDDTTDQAKAILRFLSSEVGVSQWREDDAHG